MRFILAALAIVWLPGTVTWQLLVSVLPRVCSATTDELRSETRFSIERPLWVSLFLSIATGLIVVGWLGLILAQLGWFTSIRLSAAVAIYTAICSGLLAWRCLFLRRFQSGDERVSPGVEPSGGIAGRLKRFWQAGRWENVVAALLFGGALFLYSLPAEYLPAFFDPGWYFNAGALVAKTGAITFENQAFSILPAGLRPLFFSSFSALRYDFPQLPRSGSRGFFLTAFAVPDVGQGTITPYHPPGLSIWLALFSVFGGLRAALYLPVLFGALSVLAMLLAGRTLFGRGVGLLAALLLALSLPQIYYSRTSYAEIVLQFFVLVGLYGLTAFAQRGDSAHAALAGLAFGQALLTKIESALFVIPLAIFWVVWLGRQRAIRWCSGYRGIFVFGLPFAALAGHALLVAATVNRLYVILNGYGLWSRLRLVLGWMPLWLGLAGMAIAAGVWLWLHRWSWRAWSVSWLVHSPPPSVRRAVAWGILLLAAYGYFIQPLIGSIVPGGLSASGTPSLVQSGRFLSPWGLWLGVVGLVLLVDRDCVWHQLFFVVLVLTTCAIILAVPTISAGVSPLYAIRRQVPAVIPAFLLLASYALVSGWQFVTGFLGPPTPPACDRSEAGVVSLLKQRLTVIRFAQGAAILVLVVGLLGVARPYLRYREMRGTVDFVERLAAKFPSSALVLFESVGRESHVGRFAAPLWAIHGLDTLTLSSPAIPEGMDRALTIWAPRYSDMYWVSTSPRPPVMVPGFHFDLVADELWQSSAIAPDPAYPPRIEWLEVPFYIYRITPQSPG